MARLWGTAEALREAMNAPMRPVYCADCEQAVAAVCTQLGEEPFATVWAQGRITLLEQTINIALKMGSETRK